MRGPLRPARVVLAVAVAGLLAGCGGGFSGGPKSAPDESIATYVALGDDFAAAPGTGGQESDDDCARSDANYPALVAKDLEVSELRDLSCAGATSESITAETEGDKGRDPVPPQVDAIDRDTDLVTLTAGIHDRDLLSHVFEICTALPCGDKTTPQTILDDVSSMAESLTAAVRKIQDDAVDANIVIVGYPEIAPREGSCPALPDIDQTELEAANAVLEGINHQMLSTARETGAAFLDVAQLSEGHDLCSSDPWVESRKKGRTRVYRPVAAEQRAVAEALAALVRTR